MWLVRLTVLATQAAFHASIFSFEIVDEAIAHRNGTSPIIFESASRAVRCERLQRRLVTGYRGLMNRNWREFVLTRQSEGKPTAFHKR